MSKPMVNDCERFEALLAERATGAGALHDELEAHLAACDVCSEVLSRLRDGAFALDDIPEPSLFVRDQPRAAGEGGPVRERPRRLAWMQIAAASALSCLATWLVVTHTRGEPESFARSDLGLEQQQSRAVSAPAGAATQGCSSAAAPTAPVILPSIVPSATVASGVVSASSSAFVVPSVAPTVVPSVARPTVIAVDPPGNSGTLAIGCSPTCQVTVDGRAMGAAPILVEIAEGLHRLEFRNGDVRKTTAVQVTAGQRSVVRIDMQPPSRPPTRDPIFGDPLNSRN
ncbi:MAG: hypothetical protein U0271_19365 [Polyangiaceae bacterium]